MNQGPDESTPPGVCPLCQTRVPVPPEPRNPGDVIAVLGTHFGTACKATVLAHRQRFA